MNVSFPKCVRILGGVVAAFAFLSAISLEAAKPKKGKDPETPEQQRAKAIEQIEKQIEKKAGKKPEGTYVVAFDRTEWVFVQKAGRVAPFTRTFVDQFADRKAAAEAIVDCLVKFANLRPTLGNDRAPTTRPPMVTWRVVGRYENAEQATAAVERARATLKAQGTSLGAMPEP
jgi:hypothetical protein